MSKDITIQEGGTARTFTGVTKLKTAQAGGGSVYWVPEGETQLGHKSISADGTYYAADDGYYGFEYVVVNGITGKDPNADDDDDHNITVDPNTGDLVNTRLPASIAITTLPSKTGYVDGETIDLTGIVVKAYYEDGTEWGTVPASALSPDPAAADIGSVTDEKYATSSLDTNWEQPIPINGDVQLGSGTYATYVKMGAGAVNLIVFAPPDASGSTREFVFVSKSAGATVRIYQPDAPAGIDTTITLNRTVTIDGKTAYYYRETLVNRGAAVPSVTPSRGAPDENTIWTAVWGTITDIGQPITVNWPRTGDGKVLSDTFMIQVTDA